MEEPLLQKHARRIEIKDSKFRIHDLFSNLTNQIIDMEHCKKNDPSDNKQLKKKIFGICSYKL